MCVSTFEHFARGSTHGLSPSDRSRLEPSKNILRGFLAHELFLKQHPEWLGRVKFLALLSPSREEMKAYQRYGDEALAEAERINDAFRTPGWQPIDVRVQEDFHYAVAAYTRYDVLLVNPVYDGMARS